LTTVVSVLDLDGVRGHPEAIAEQGSVSRRGLQAGLLEVFEQEGFEAVADGDLARLAALLPEPQR